jgi:hypothetical protein
LLTLQSMMLVVLGILIASLLVVAILPAYRSRIRRLTTDEIRRAVPLTEAEIRADKDRLRAQYAIRVHKLEAEAEQMKLSSARQRIEMNRRDARITELQDELDRFRAVLEENVNARRVLEHTVTDRLPRLEQQLDSARALIRERDGEMQAIKSEATRSVRALDEAMQVNAQQRMEIERLSTGSTVRGSADRATAEVKALQARIDAQAAEVARLKAALDVYEAGGDRATEGAPGGELEVKARLSALEAQNAQQSETIQRLRGDLAASNERLARQAAAHIEEMRRLGAGLGANIGAASVTPRRGQEPRQSLADRMSPANSPSAAAPDSADGITDPATGRVSEFMRALGDDPPRASGSAETVGPPEAAAAGSVAEPAPRKRRLLERIASAGKA